MLLPNACSAEELLGHADAGHCSCEVQNVAITQATKIGKPLEDLTASACATKQKPRTKDTLKTAQTSYL